jgi:phage-related tail protein
LEESARALGESTSELEQLKRSRDEDVALKQSLAEELKLVTCALEESKARAAKTQVAHSLELAQAKRPSEGGAVARANRAAQEQAELLRRSRHHAEDLAARLKSAEDTVAEFGNLVNAHYNQKRARVSRSGSPGRRHQTVETAPRTTYQSQGPRVQNQSR